jgi:hypothetical protein
MKVYEKRQQKYFLYLKIIISAEQEQSGEFQERSLVESGAKKLKSAFYILYSQLF